MMREVLPEYYKMKKRLERRYREDVWNGPPWCGTSTEDLGVDGDEVP
jgi:hypothetical protein